MIIQYILLVAENGNLDGAKAPVFNYEEYIIVTRVG